VEARAAGGARRTGPQSKSSQLPWVAAHDQAVLLAALFLLIKTTEVRRLAVALHSQDGQIRAVSAANAHMSRRTLTCFLAYVEETGDVDYDLEKWNSHADNQTRCPDVRAAVLYAVEYCPEVYLDEIKDFVSRVQAFLRTDCSESVSSVSRILAANGITRKVIETCFISRNELTIAQWFHSQCDFPLRTRVFVDEAHRCDRSAERKWAWKLRGERTECHVSNNKGVRSIIFVAMGHDQVLDWMITQPPPGQSSVDFLLFVLAHLLPSMNAYDPDLPWADQPDRCVLILDNARVYDELALAVIEAAGVFVCRLPPHSPDFNPIEDAFSFGSSWLRRSVTPEQFIDRPFLSIAAMLSHITPAMCAGFVRAAVKNYCFYI